MEGRVLSHYRILTRLGGGGMGVVYKAEDTRLKRHVALKFLPPELTRSDDARERFVEEAQAASALDHPNICTIYEIDSTSEGQLFISMAYYDGETLKTRLTRGPVPIQEAVDIAIQISLGLEKAHHAGIVHRDLKPANVMLTADGLVKIVDFGIAKLIDRTGPTRTGTLVGTVAYMAPEQAKGTAVDQRIDLWALGVVLYEMLTGCLPFGGDQPAAIINNILNEQSTPVTTLRADVPSALDRIVRRALGKLPDDRYRTAAEINQDLLSCHASVTGAAAGKAGPGTAVPRSSRRAVIAAAIVVAVAVGGPAAWYVTRTVNARRADEGIAEVTRLADRDEYATALARAEEVERLVPGDARLAALWDRIALRRSIATDPPGAEVSLKGYADVTGEWKPLGRTPIANARLARGVFRWKVVKEGFEPLEFIGPTQLLPAAGLALPLAASGSMPPNMVAIPRSNVSLTLTGYNYTRTVPAGDFLIDKYEVTNRQFKEFVDAGGYAKREYWKQAFVRAGRIVPWELAVGEFRDRTGRPGPSTWEVGTYPAGQDNYPVGGVSWYEAAAYAEFAGKSLPTVYHWLRAAGVEQAAYITPLSNLEGRGPAEVGSHPGVTPAGAFDMAGNVKEWCWNEMANRSDRYLLGGAWSEPPHMFQHPDARSPFDRSETNGFRLVKYVDAHPLAGALTQALEAPSRDYSKEKPVRDQVFQAFRAIYAYDARPLDARTESVDDTAEYWVKEKVSFRAAYGDERVTAYLFVPKHVRPPFQTVVYAPGAGAIQTRTSDTLQMGNIDFLMVSGRAVLYPVYQGTYERNTGQISSWPEITRAYQDWLVQVLNDARRAVDYLETRDDVRQDKLAYQGFSWGAAFGVRVLAMEPRFKAAVLLDGGLSQEARVLPQVDSFNYAPRVALPVLMVNGSSDFIFPVETSQKPLWAYLGTPPEHKRHVTLPGGHGVVGQQRSQVVREVLNWLDRYLGPVQR